jgi:SPP1 family predicted phage head-tail adaptor
MRAGELRHRVTIQQATTARDGFGAEVETWADLATVWAKVETVSGTETIGPEQLETATLTHQVTVRWRDDLKPTMQVLWKDRTFTIRAVIADNANKQITLLCDEVVA